MEATSEKAKRKLPYDRSARRGNVATLYREWTRVSYASHLSNPDYRAPSRIIAMPYQRTRSSTPTSPRQRTSRPRLARPTLKPSLWRLRITSAYHGPSPNGRRTTDCGHTSRKTMPDPLGRGSRWTCGPSSRRISGPRCRAPWRYSSFRSNIFQ